ncbi:MAG: cytochrome c maturation protein CcmE [Aggregatilineales bacterium]
MAQAAWEIPQDQQDKKSATLRQLNRRGERMKFMVGGVLIFGSILYLIISGTLTGASFFITVNDVVGDTKYVGETVRISGAVIGETIRYTPAEGDGGNSTLTFTISHIPEEFDNLAEALYISVNDANATHLQIYMENEVMPDLLQHEAQAIITGTMRPDGVFEATELLLKCPSRFEEGGSSQSLGANHPEVPVDDAG